MISLRTTAALAALSLPFTANGATMTQPDIKQNPNPKMRYEITATIEGAPGPFDRIHGIADYRVTNELCVPPTPVMGARIVPEKRADIEFRHEHDNVYRATVYLDLLEDEDYFGKGTCHWALMAAGIELTHATVTFSASLFHDDVLAGKTVPRYFAEGSYAKAQTEHVDTGIADRAQFHGAGSLFSVTMKAEERTP
jgi:hypothetical protein